MSRYKAYPEYKESGAECLGLIPKSWFSTSLKRYSRITDGSHHSPKIEVDGRPFISVSDVGLDSINFEDCKKISEVDYLTLVREGCKPQVGDVLLTKDGTIGRAAIVKSIYPEFVILSSLGLLSPKDEIHNIFLYYFLISGVNVDQMNSMIHGSALRRMTIGKISDLQIGVPSICEQQKIANFLDHETAKIDTLIAKQQELIKLLKEKRQAVISHAVTKGINPNAPMRDSGVEWLGEVPAHWDVLATKKFFSLKADPAPNNNDMELLSVYTDIGVRPRKELEEKGNKASTTDGYWIVRKGDLIVNKLLAWMGAVGYSEYDGVTSPAYDILRKKRELNAKFFHYLFRTKIAQSEFKRWSRGIMEMRLRLYFEELGRIPMPFPSKDEQDEIVAEIERLESRFDQLIEVAESSIKLSQERRTALISAAVTGKIDVRDWQPPIESAIAA